MEMPPSLLDVLVLGHRAERAVTVVEDSQHRMPAISEIDEHLVARQVAL